MHLLILVMWVCSVLHSILLQQYYLCNFFSSFSQHFPFSIPWQIRYKKLCGKMCKKPITFYQSVIHIKGLQLYYSALCFRQFSHFVDIMQDIEREWACGWWRSRDQLHLQRVATKSITLHAELSSLSSYNMLTSTKQHHFSVLLWYAEVAEMLAMYNRNYHLTLSRAFFLPGASSRGEEIIVGMLLFDYTFITYSEFVKQQCCDSYKYYSLRTSELE